MGAHSSASTSASLPPSARSTRSGARLEETAFQIATEASLSTEEAVEAIENILVLADVVLEGMASVYEANIGQ
ncbi:MAG: hypothetical protein M5U18_06645 [Dehalococcoidia bacterium]|nr:hypothetical protein [Dehalococcoidia bacterium]